MVGGSAICERCYHEGDHQWHDFGNSSKKLALVWKSYAWPQFGTIGEDNALKWNTKRICDFWLPTDSHRNNWEEFL